MPWRRTGVKYTNNEAYFDVVEEVDAIIDKAGSTVFAEIQGYVRVTLKPFLYFITCLGVSFHPDGDADKGLQFSFPSF